jgi:uncharacterized protein YndB with AHSA1/START domain
MNTPITEHKTINKTVNIHAPAPKIWEALTDPAIMKKWIGETEINIITDWQVGNPIILRGKLHGIRFENKGTVLQCESEKVLQYTHLSSISRLPDQPESYSILEFRLTPLENQNHTSLTLTVTNFPTETIYKHLAFYWNVTLEIIKKLVEQSA